MQIFIILVQQFLRLNETKEEHSGLDRPRLARPGLVRPRLARPKFGQIYSLCVYDRYCYFVVFASMWPKDKMCTIDNMYNIILINIVPLIF